MIGVFVLHAPTLPLQVTADRRSAGTVVAYERMEGVISGHARLARSFESKQGHFLNHFEEVEESDGVRDRRNPTP